MAYPQRAKDALTRIENTHISKKYDHNQDIICMDLISQMIFLEKKNADRSRGGGSSIQQQQTQANGNTNTMTLIQEFQLVVVLTEFFSRSTPEVTKNAIFLSLFGVGNGNANNTARSRVLSKLISTAISGSIAPILRSAGTWMQQLGPTSNPSLELSLRLVEDFINFSKKCLDQLKSLPIVAPRFTINFMTSVADLFLHDLKLGKPDTLPPESLLNIFTDWIIENPTLCLAVQPPLLLPAGAIGMPVVSPLVGLIRWCVLAPLYQIPHESPSYSQLHLAILQSLTQTQTTNGVGNGIVAGGGTNTFTPLNALHLGAIVVALKHKYDQIQEFKEPIAMEYEERLQTSLERFAQSIQLALSYRSISGNVTQLMCRIETLPKNTLLQIVIKAHKVTL